MNKLKKQFIFCGLFSIAIFYICWGISQFLSTEMQRPLLSSLLFSILFTGIIGCFIPMYFKNRFRWNYNAPSSNRILGYGFLLVAIIFSTFLSGALSRFVELNYSPILILKYILLFFPMSLGIGLFAFLLIPNMVQGWKNNKKRSAILVISIGMFFFLAFYVDSLFQDISLAGTMGLIGILLGLGYIFLRNFWVVYSALFIIMLVNTLADNKYDNYSYWMVIVSTLLSLTILTLDYIWNRKRKHLSL